MTTKSATINVANMDESAIIVGKALLRGIAKRTAPNHPEWVFRDECGVYDLSLCKNEFTKDELASMMSTLLYLRDAKVMNQLLVVGNDKKKSGVFTTYEAKLQAKIDKEVEQLIKDGLKPEQAKLYAEQSLKAKLANYEKEHPKSKRGSTKTPEQIKREAYDKKVNALQKLVESGRMPAEVLIPRLAELKAEYGY